jgi:hypothetical protein
MIDQIESHRHAIERVKQQLTDVKAAASEVLVATGRSQAAQLLAHIAGSAMHTKLDKLRQGAENAGERLHEAEGPVYE